METEIKKSLPRPSDDFLKAFVKAQGKISEVLVEYNTEDCGVVDGICLCGGDGINKCYTKTTEKLKVSSDNTITIKPIQEQKTSWSREELELFFKWMLDNRVYLDTNGCIEYKIPYEKEQGMSDIFDKYLKQNL